MQTASRTNRGLVRKNNEDSILVRCPDLFAIADGMGGEQAGEVASSLSVHYLSKVDLSGVQDGEILKYLREVIETINAKVSQLRKDQAEFVMTANLIEQQIQELLCIEYKPEEEHD